MGYKWDFFRRFAAMKASAFVLAFLASFFLATNPAAAGEWSKHVKGKVEISVQAKSKSSVEIYEYVIHKGLPHWSHVTTIHPGKSWTGHIKPIVKGDSLKFVCNGRNFKSASDVTGGFDLHFDNVWLNLRHK